MKQLTVILLLSLAGLAHASDTELLETLELIANDNWPIPSARGWNAYENLKNDPRDLSDDLRGLILESGESYSIPTLALELMRVRGELGESDIPIIKSRTRQAHESLKEENLEYTNEISRSSNKVLTGLRALSEFGGSSFEEDFIIEFVFSDEHLVKIDAARLLSQYGSEKSVQALQAALDRMPTDARYRGQIEGSLKQLRERLTTETIEESVAEIPPTPPLQEVAETIEKVTVPEPAIEEPAEVVIAEPIEQNVEQSSNWWLWLIAAVVLVGGVFVVRSRK